MFGINKKTEIEKAINSTNKEPRSTAEKLKVGAAVLAGTVTAGAAMGVVGVRAHELASSDDKVGYKSTLEDGSGVHEYSPIVDDVDESSRSTVSMPVELTADPSDTIVVVAGSDDTISTMVDSARDLQNGRDVDTTEEVSRILEDRGTDVIHAGESLTLHPREYPESPSAPSQE